MNLLKRNGRCAVKAMILTVAMIAVACSSPAGPTGLSATSATNPCRPKSSLPTPPRSGSVKMIAHGQVHADSDVLVPNVDLPLLRKYARCLVGETVGRNDQGRVTYTFSVAQGTTEVELRVLVAALEKTGQFQGVSIER